MGWNHQLASWIFSLVFFGHSTKSNRLKDRNVTDVTDQDSLPPSSRVVDEELGPNLPQLPTQTPGNSRPYWGHFWRDDGGSYIPIWSTYGIFTYIWLIFMVNVGKYTIHGSYGILYF